MIGYVFAKNYLLIRKESANIIIYIVFFNVGRLRPILVFHWLIFQGSPIISLPRRYTFIGADDTGGAESS